ncbi:PIR Superfamily Protein [Plasmodium ovale curtisi]|uniref:PIR Superfamily Protein n=1 Tax=Plasmodium ovale curtisi TaxID=864141 RepID=A0A1A8XE37_PLAOA|nr:PIR Superfamily Protein [Plasmodium ovale curtisi]
MGKGITINDLPSRKFNNFWKEGICYEEVNKIITEGKPPGDANKWISNFETKLKSYLVTHVDELKDKNPKKRCRDLYYVIYDILHKIKKLSGYDESYSLIQNAIQEHIKTSAQYSGYSDCVDYTFEEDIDYVQDNIENKKKIDDLGEDVNYVSEKIDQINRSPQCNEIKLKLETDCSTLKEIYKADFSEYLDILQYYNEKNFDNFDSTIAKITCSTIGNVKKEHLQDTDGSLNFSTLHIFMITPFRTWFDTNIRKKIKILNRLNYNATDDILDETPEYLQTNSHNDRYNIKYNSTWDS